MQRRLWPKNKYQLSTNRCSVTLVNISNIRCSTYTCLYIYIYKYVYIYIHSTYKMTWLLVLLNRLFDYGVNVVYCHSPYIYKLLLQANQRRFKAEAWREATDIPESPDGSGSVWRPVLLSTFLGRFMTANGE